MNVSSSRRNHTKKKNVSALTRVVFDGYGHDKNQRDEDRRKKEKNLPESLSKSKEKKRRDIYINGRDLGVKEKRKCCFNKNFISYGLRWNYSWR